MHVRLNVIIDPFNFDCPHLVVLSELTDEKKPLRDNSEIRGQTVYVATCAVKWSLDLWLPCRPVQLVTNEVLCIGSLTPDAELIDGSPHPIVNL